ncbi:DUF645 family protein [Vibrio mimicus]
MKLLEFKCYKLTFEFLPDGYLVERVESSVVSRSLKTNKSRCFKVVGCSTLEVWFHKKLHHSCNCVFFFVDSVRGQLNLERCEFWRSTSQHLALDMCLLGAFA